MRAGWALALALAASAAAPTRAEKTPADKSVPVTVGPWRFVAGAPPAGWTDPAFDDRTWGGPASGPFGPRPPALAPGPGTHTPPQQPPQGTFYDAVPRAPLLLRARFSVADAAHVRVLDLRVAYADGFIAYVNGREVARRGMGPNGGPPPVPHGPELERVSIPVSSASPLALRAEGNLLAVAVYGWSGRNPTFPTAPAVAIDVGAASGVRIVRGPYLSTPSERKHGYALRMNWETDLPSTGMVTTDPGTTGGMHQPRAVEARTPATRHAVTLDDLMPGAAYRYTLSVEAAAGDVATASSIFKAIDQRSQPFRFAVYGDMRYPGHAAHRAVVEALVREAPPLIFNTGDLTDVGSEESNWQKYFEITAPMGAIAPVVPALGNHDADRHGAGAPIAWSLFGVPANGPPGWTSLDLGGVHFVILSTNEMRNPAQRAWLKDDLARARRLHPRAIFAFCHEGPWSHALHAGESIMAHEYAPLLAAAHVDVLFSGHDHVYERGVGSTPEGPLTYVVTGGGGAPLYNPRCQAATGPPPIGVPGPLPACPLSVQVLTNAYHYLMVEVSAHGITLCPRRPDGTPVEACVELPLQHARPRSSAHGSD